MIVLCVLGCSSVVDSKSDYAFVSSLKSGDIVCRLGKGHYAPFFKNCSSEERKYSHVGIVSIENSGAYIIHADASEYTGIGGVQKESLADFLRGSTKYSFFRYNCSDSVRSSIVKIANSYLLKKTKFDLVFNMSNDDRLYCSELVAVSVNTALRYNFILPSFEIINKLFYGIDDVYLNKDVVVIFSKD